MLGKKLHGKLDKWRHKLAVRWLETIDRWAFRPYHESPYRDKPHTNRDDYIQRLQAVQQQVHPEIDAYLQKTGFTIDQDWFQNLALLTRTPLFPNPLCCNEHGSLIYSTLSAYITSQELPSVNILETGTRLGFSCLCAAKALQDQGKPGKVITVDRIPPDVKMYWDCIADHQQGPQTRFELLRDYQDLLDQYLIFLQGDTRLQLKKLHLSRIHYAVLDGGHTYEDIDLEVAYLQGKQEPGDIVFFDDYTPAQFPEVVKAIDDVCQKYQYSQEALSASSGPDKGYVIAVKL